MSALRPLSGVIRTLADIARMTEFDPRETLAESKSRNAAVSRDGEVCYPFGWKPGRHW
jgi:hypothetical protein